MAAAMTALADHALHAGALFEGRYQIVGALGGGAFSRVYQARQLSTGQDVAIKVVAPRSDARGAADTHAERLRREMRLCIELFHPNIVRLVDSGETESGAVYAAFEYVPGATLKQVLLDEGKLSLRETVHLMSQVLDALSCAHAQGIVHRDLKPENIMVTATGARRNAMVLDFGLGGFAPAADGWGLPRITATQEMMGTPCYAAPEQLRGEAPTTRSDLYSWGLIVIECLTGELAVRGASVQEAILKQLNDDPIAIPAGLPTRLRAVLEAVTTKTVERRTATIEGLLHALGVVEAGVADDADDGLDPQRARAGERRQVTLVACRLRVARADGQRLELEQLDELLHEQYARVAELAARGGGHVAGAFGDRVMLVFGYPQAREDDARRAARTALGLVADVQSRSAHLLTTRGIGLQAHVGMHTGVVIARALRRPGMPDAVDLVGPTPQVALRLETVAAPGEVLASLDTQRLLRREIERAPAPACDIPELGGSVQVFRLTGVRHTPAGVETIQSERESPLVGRAAQLAQLVERWKQVQPGRGAVVLVTGEPGIGKSRLLRELRRHVPTESWIGLQCAAENQNSPLRPFVDLLTTGEQPVGALLARSGLDDADTAALFAELLSLPGDVPPPALPPERRKEATLAALVTLVFRMAADRPLVFAMEDLHWADPTSLEAVQMLIDELRAPDAGAAADAPQLCVVLTARPQFSPTWPIDNTLLLPLPHLTSQQVEEMVAANVSDHDALPRAVIDEVVTRSDGIPLFVEEVTRVLLESDGAGGDSGPAVPATLRDLITARLDGVSVAARETAQLASVLGREFRYEYLRAIALQPEAAVRADVRELVNAGLLYQRRSARAESYLFKHALLRDVAYESMPRPARQTLHERTADTLRERFPDVERTQPEVLAHHYERGGQRASALDYWRLAGERAVGRGAYVESIRHFEAGLALLETMPRARRQQEAELALRTALGVGLIATRGYGAEAVEHNYTRAQELCLGLGDAPQQLPALYGLWTYHLLRDHRDTPGELAARLTQIARAPEHVLIATATRGITAYFGGDLPAAIVDLERATALYALAHQRVLARELGQDAALLAPLYSIWCLFHLGRFDQARARLGVVEGLVTEVASPYITATWLIFAMLLGLSLEDVEMTTGFAEQAVTLSVEQRFPFFLATATCGLGWTRIVQDDVEAGIAKIQEGLGVLALTGAVVARSYWLACIAEGHLRRRDASAGLAVVDQGLALTLGNLNRLQDPWLHRVKGDLLALAGDPAGAEQSLHTALRVARHSGDKPFELRAMMSLTRLLRQQGRGEEARAPLAAVAGSFDEGFDSRDLRDAHALLAELA
ncbi:MAG: TOMM system kinase/cyclase fusion protein [Deltaproteobacteria bacterium]|nr:TOMM system kinase/cyclase fusion protein [Deltaproteobacteria bacterium]